MHRGKKDEEWNGEASVLLCVVVGSPQKAVGLFFLSFFPSFLPLLQKKRAAVLQQFLLSLLLSFFLLVQMAILPRHSSYLHYLLAAAILLYCLHAAFNIKLSASSSSSVHNSRLAERRGPVPRIRKTDHVHQPSEEETRKERSLKVDKRSPKNSLLIVGDNGAAKEETAAGPEASAREGGSNLKMQRKAKEDLSGSSLATIADRDAVIQNGIGPQEEIQPSGRKGIDSGENGRNDEVTFSMTVTLDDAPLVGFMVPHILRGCNYPFARKVIFVDNNGQSFSGTKLAKELEKLKKDGVINDIKQVNYSPANIEKLYKKVFGTDFNKTYTLHNITGEKVFQTKVFGNKGFLSYVESVEDCMKTKYCVHLDIDIVVNTRHNYSWVREGLDVIDKYDDIVSVSPLCGPPIRPGIVALLLFKQNTFEY